MNANGTDLVADLVAGRRRAWLVSAAAAEAVQQHLTALAGGLDRAARAVPGVSGWEGAAARAAGAHLLLDTDRLAGLATGFAAAAQAAGRHGEQLSAAAATLRGDDAAALARAEAAVAASTGQCAAAFDALTGAAPARRGGLVEAAHRLSGWLGELQFGAGEAMLGLASTAVAAATTPLSVTRRDGALDVGDVLDVVRHPGELFAALLDVHTWQENPARAIGHLVPDAVAALLTGGASAAARGRAVGRLESAAAERSAVAQTREVTARGARAAESQNWLTEGALHRALHAPAPARLVEADGLSHLDRVVVDAMYREYVAGEGALTERVQRLAAELGGDLVGLPNRVKTPESYARKFASRLAESGKQDRVSVLEKNSDDLVRYRLVVNSHRYVATARQLAGALSRDGYHLKRIFPAWALPEHAYRGLNTIWQEVDTGRMFEMQLHTPASLAAAVEAWPLYDLGRTLPRNHPGKAELNELMREIYAKAPPPAGVEKVTRAWDSLIPKPPPAPFAPPPDRAALHGVLAGAGTAAAGAPSRH